MIAKPSCKENCENLHMRNLSCAENSFFDT